MRINVKNNVKYEIKNGIYQISENILALEHIKYDIN